MLFCSSLWRWRICLSILVTECGYCSVGIEKMEIIKQHLYTCVLTWPLVDWLWFIKLCLRAHDDCQERRLQFPVGECAWCAEFEYTQVGYDTLNALNFPFEIHLSYQHFINLGFVKQICYILPFLISLGFFLSLQKLFTNGFYGLSVN